MTWLQQQNEKALEPAAPAPQAPQGKQKGICWLRQVAEGGFLEGGCQEKCWKAQCQVQGCNRQRKFKVKELSEEPGREVQDLFERSWPAKDALRQTFEKAAPRLKRKGLRHPRKSTCVPFMASCVDGFATLAKGSEMSSTKSLKDP